MARVRLLGWVLWLAALGALAGVMATAPAFQGARPVAVAGALFDRPEHRYQTAFRLLAADRLGAAEDPDGAAAEAAALLDQALAERPADAFAWALLSEARARLGDRDGAAEALQTSWRLAPHSAALAARRITLAPLLGLDGMDGMARDRATLALHRPAVAARLEP